ncbi:hypothetical protein C6376_39785 [Streptomyces sp. P3]|uniref:hypothetical protein n=1 Tax=Streptomyces sp. P3 TaxID=2135430 RepID=UPI000D1B0FF7|nr:hypothetical protein [Streptomyces sp. P3]AVV46595.1 hypothetical protein C6376_39785 [Streptomyces sp. P3]
MADARARVVVRVREEEFQAQARRAAQEQAAKQAAEREARRPVCTGCGAKFTDERWEAAQGQAKDWGASKDSHPHLCDSCKHAAQPGPPTGVWAAVRGVGVPGLDRGGGGRRPLGVGPDLVVSASSQVWKPA